MKKLIAIAAVVALVTACGKKDSTEEQTTPPVVVQPPPAPSDTPTVPGKKIAGKPVKYSRWILISGDAPSPGCQDAGGGMQWCP